MSQTKPYTVLYADFHNADQDGFIRLNSCGTLVDIKKKNIELESGDIFMFSDGELSIIGVVEKPGIEGVWRARIDWKKLS